MALMRQIITDNPSVDGCENQFNLRHLPILRTSCVQLIVTFPFLPSKSYVFPG